MDILHLHADGSPIYETIHLDLVRFYRYNSDNKTLEIYWNGLPDNDRLLVEGVSKDAYQGFSRRMVE